MVVSKESPFSGLKRFGQWSNGAPVLYTNWLRGEPNNVGGNEDCVVLLLDTGQWNDYICDEHNFAYICKLEKGSYGAWSEWGPCSETCQSNPSMSPIQTRKCIGASSIRGCYGASYQTCNTGVSCSRYYSVWSQWGPCSETCQSNPNMSPGQTRQCIGDSLIVPCHGASYQTCNTGVSCPGSVSKCEKLRSLPMHFNFSFRPQCDDNGYFNSVQCWDALNQCWCVNKDGLEIKGSRVNGKKPDCSEVICEDKSNDCHKVVVVPKFCLQLNHYAKDYCRKSCGYCPVTCEDKSDDCKEFLKVPDFCAQLNQYAKEYCRKSCGYCSVYLSTTETESQKLENMEKENITESNILNFTNVLNGIVHSIEFSDITSVNSISNLLTKVINGLSLTEDVTLKKNVTSGILFSINSLLGANISLTANTNQTFDLSSKFLNIIDYLGKQQTANLSISLKNLGMASYNTKTKTNPILISSTINENIIGVSITSGESDTSEILKKKDYIFLPLELFLEQKEIQVYSFIFKDKTFFKETSGVIDSVIISVTLFNNNITKYNSPIQMKFSSNSMASGKRKCHFYIIEEQRWSSEGCKTTSSSLAEVFCQCNHLTNFALLLDVDQSGNNPLTLSTITWVGCSLSIVGLFITIMSYSSFAQLRKKLAPKILIILCINLVTSLILFLALVERTKPRGLCQGTASLLQFFILSTFFWMAIEGFNLYRMCVNVFGASTSSHRLLLKCSAFGWGIPLVITAITSLSKPDYLGPSSDNDIKICVVRSLSFYLGILLPVCVVMAANIFILVSVLRGIDQNTIMHNKNKNKKKVKMAFAFSLLLGTTWLFAVLAVGKARDIYQWLFCIFNSLQGFFIFVVYTAQNKKVREQWMLFFLKIINGMFNKLGYNSRKLIISSSSSSSNILTSKLTFSANLLQANSGSFKENKL